MGVGKRDDIREVMRSQVVVSALDLILYVEVLVLKNIK